MRSCWHWCSVSGDSPGRQQVLDHPIAVNRLAGPYQASSLASIHEPHVAIAVGPCRLIAVGIFDGDSVAPHGAPTAAGTQCAIDDLMLTRCDAAASACGAGWCRRRCCESAVVTIAPFGG